MRRALITTLAALTLAMALCTLSKVSVTRVVDHARHLRTLAIERVDAGEIEGAHETMAELAEYLRDNAGWLEMLCAHDDLAEIKEQIVDARTSLELGDRDDFYQAISRFGERLEHISDVERLKLSNLY